MDQAIGGPNKRIKVYLFGGDRSGWALDTDVRLARQALKGIVDFVEHPSQAEVLHTVWPEQLCLDPQFRPLLNTKPVVAAFCNDPVALFEQSHDLHQNAKKWFCVAQSKGAELKLRSLGISRVSHIPYIADLNHFSPTPPANPERPLPQLLQDRLIIGSFQRDSLAANLNAFKPQKGADAFAAIVSGLARRVGADRFHVLLAGPRRHWLRAQLDRLGISYTFDGKLIEGDDYSINMLDLKRICSLTHLLDVNLITSRWEGGPRALLETATCKRAVLSTPVGMVPEFLEPDCIYQNLSEAIDRLEDHLKNRTLDRSIETHYQRVTTLHTVQAVHQRWRTYYEDISKNLNSRPAELHSARAAPHNWSVEPGLIPKVMIKLAQFTKTFHPEKSITLWGEMIDGPYGGGSQVLKAIASELTRRKFRVLNNSYEETDGHILNSAWFEPQKLIQTLKSSKKKVNVVHRIDGPISLYRGKDRELDEAIFTLNREIATATAYQSFYSWHESIKMGFDAVNPFIVRNACDPRFFQKKNSVPMGNNSPNQKIKIVSTSWSTNLKKGFPTYEYLDHHLDFSKYDYTFIGRSPIAFKNIRVIDALPSELLGPELRKADLYIAASLNDPASNALLEAMASGLPALFAQSGGHNEFTWFAGLPFQRAEEIPALLNQMEKDYESYQSCTYTKSISEIVDSYLAALKLI